MMGTKETVNKHLRTDVSCFQLFKLMSLLEIKDKLRSRFGDASILVTFVPQSPTLMM